MAAPTTESDGQLSDEDWLIMRAKTSMKIDQYAAKAWMLTAQTLFPNNFSIQFESYVLEKNGGNQKEAAKMLENMYSVFSQEPRLVQEVKVILDVMQAETRDPDTHIYTDIFAELSTTTQCDMLLTVANQIQDHLEQCRLLLLAMKRFSSLVSEQGLKLVEKLLWSERQAALGTPVNSYRKLFVCDVVPLVLAKCRPQLSSKQLYKWLQKSMQFYVCYVTLPYSTDESDSDLLSPSRDMFSPTKKAKRHASMSGLSDSQSTVNSPWTSLYRVLQSVGEVLKWEMDPNNYTRSIDYQWEQIQNLYNRDKQAGSMSHQKQILFTTVLLYLESLYNYITAVNPEVFSHGTSNQHIVLLDSLSSDIINDEPVTKKSRQEKSNIWPTSQVTNAAVVIQNFTTALKCHQLLLSTELLKKDFCKLRQLWQMDSWTWTFCFHIHMAIYNGSHDDAMVLLQKDITTLRSHCQLPAKLQLANCHYRLKHFKSSCEHLLHVIGSLESSRDKKCDVSLADNSPRSDAGLVLATFTRAEILPHCVQLLISLLKDKFKTEQNNDTLVGHLIVMLQSDWPRQEVLFSQCITHITHKGTFSYLPFFSYVINVDILEEFAYVQSTQGGSVKLDVLLSDDNDTQLKSRSQTRGVNKENQEEFDETMERQMRRCHEPINTLLLDFISTNHESFLQTLT